MPGVAPCCSTSFVAHSFAGVQKKVDTCCFLLLSHPRNDRSVCSRVKGDQVSVDAAGVRRQLGERRVIAQAADPRRRPNTPRRAPHAPADDRSYTLEAAAILSFVRG